VEIGNLYLDSGFADDARVYYERALDQEPTNPLASIGLAKIRREQGDREGALSLYERAIAAGPDIVEPYLALGQAYRSWEMWEEALEIYEQGLAVHPRVVELVLGMVEVNRVQGETELALIRCQEAIELAPEGSLPYLTLGDIYSDLGMVEEAIEAYQQAARRMPPLPVVYLHQGNLYRDHGRSEEAIAAYDEAIRLDPTSPSLYLIKGDACRRWDRVEEAMASYARAIELDPKLRGDLEGFQDLVGFLDASIAPAGDRAMFSRDWQERFTWYYSEGQTDVGEDSLVIEGRSLEEMRAEVFSATSGAEKWWLVLFGQPDLDPHSQVERMLDERGYRAFNRWYGEHRLVLYGMPAGGASPQWVARTVDLDGQVELDSYRLEESELEAGGVVKLGVRWRALTDLGDDYKVFVHIVGPYGKLWGQLDTVPGNGFRPTSGWEEGDTVEDRYGVLISTEAPPGTHELRIGLYQEEGGERLENRPEASSNGDTLDYCPLEAVEVLR
jgi:tetratricopeptide (TPR) repeat protein